MPDNIKDASPPHDPNCPNCGHRFTLADLKRMAVGDGFERYLIIENGASRFPVSFSDFNPLEPDASPRV